MPGAVDIDLFQTAVQKSLGHPLPGRPGRGAFGIAVVNTGELLPGLLQRLAGGEFQQAEYPPAAAQQPEESFDPVVGTETAPG